MTANICLLKHNLFWQGVLVSKLLSWDIIQISLTIFHNHFIINIVINKMQIEKEVRCDI